jgi:curved DNA-binding protein CbpA
MRRTLYEILMLHPRADRDVIRVVYRHLAKRYHPDRDRSPEAQSRMAELNEAYEVLDDPDRRARYDEILAGGDGPPRPVGDADAGGRRDRRTAEPLATAGSRSSSEPMPSAWFGEAGPPPHNPEPVGSVMTFGRYRGWALNQVARFDRDYIEWLSRTPAGRTYQQELADLLRRTR